MLKNRLPSFESNFFFKMNNGFGYFQLNNDVYSQAFIEFSVQHNGIALDLGAGKIEVRLKERDANEHLSFHFGIYDGNEFDFCLFFTYCIDVILVGL